MKKAKIILVSLLLGVSSMLLTGCCMHEKSEATCTEPEICIKCGEKFGEAKGHDFEKASCTTPEICKDCGEEGEELGHDYAPANCTSAKECKRYGETSGEALGHNFEYAACNSEGVCSKCGDTNGEIKDHKYEEATCTYPKECVNCRESFGDPLGHEYNDATCTESKSCVRCGISEGDPLGHKYENGTCVRCEEIDPDSVPVGLNTVHVIDCGCYDFSYGPHSDSYGNSNMNVHNFYQDSGYAVFNLNKNYSVFSGTIVASVEAPSKLTASINIYVDNQLVYTATDITKLTQGIEFSVNVKDATTLHIKFTSNCPQGGTRMVQITNALLSKY